MTDAGALQAVKAELAALKASLDVAARNDNSQLAKIADRLARVERTNNEPATKLARIAEAIDRLEKKSGAAAQATGAISAKTENAGPPEPKIDDRVLDGWIVQNVRHGRALLESRNGGVFIVRAGTSIPGLGRVEAIKRQDGEWVVVTARGQITSGP
jgi:hypothetical protein